MITTNQFSTKQRAVKQSHPHKNSLLLVLLAMSYFCFAGLSEASPIANAFRCDLNNDIHATECEALRQIYLHSSGDNWIYPNNSTPWFNTASPCDWFGITCEQGKVSELALVNNNMQGRLSNLNGLPYLRVLTVAEQPNLTGNLPNLSHLQTLTHLTVSHTSISGFLPEMSNLPILESVNVSHNQLIGPVPELYAIVSFAGEGNQLCLSPRLNYDTLVNNWPENLLSDNQPPNNPLSDNHNLGNTNSSDSVTDENGLCQPMLRRVLHGKIDVTQFGAIANDNQTDDQAINHAITMLTLTLAPDEMLSNLTLHFPAGIYDMEHSIAIRDFNAVRVTGERDNNGEVASVLRKTELFGNNKNERIAKSKQGALLELSYGYDVTIKDLQLEGQHREADNTYLWWDHGIYFGSVDHSVVTNNRFYHFGDSALTIVTDTEDNRGAINSANHLVFANYFYNIMQTSTTSSYGGSMEYNFIGNTAEHVKGAIKFSTRKEGAGFLNIMDNTIVSAGAHEGISSNNGIEIEGYRNVNVIGNTLSDGNGIGIVIRSVQSGNSQSAFKWGNVLVMGNQINNYRQGIYISNLPHASDGSQAPAENINISGNLIKNMWNGEHQAVIQFVGEQYDHCKVTNNTIVGARYDLWSEQENGEETNQSQWLLVEGNVID